MKFAVGSFVLYDVERRNEKKFSEPLKSVKKGLNMEEELENCLFFKRARGKKEEDVKMKNSYFVRIFFKLV